MKKLLLSVICVVLFCSGSKAQLDTIPNAGFENWYLPPNWTIQATGWQSNNSSIAAWNVIPDSMPHSGLLALKLIVYSYRGRIWSGFPLTNHPSALDGFMKNGLNIADTAFIHIHVYNSNTLVDSGYAEIYGGIGTTFLPFFVNISQNSSSADSCVITLEGGSAFGSEISFDDLSLSFPTSTDENKPEEGLTVFPNPCNTALTVRKISARGKNSVATLTDAAGKIIYTEKLPQLQSSMVISMQKFAAGVYFFSISSDAERSNYLIIKN